MNSPQFLECVIQAIISFTFTYTHSHAIDLSFSSSLHIPSPPHVVALLEQSIFGEVWIATGHSLKTNPLGLCGKKWKLLVYIIITGLKWNRINEDY